jgi:hypothetical protein
MLDEFFSPQFEILLLEAYEEMEEDDSILFNRKEKLMEIFDYFTII